MGSNPSAFQGCKRCPVETVSWDEIQSFFERLNGGGKNNRLPSEAEWEFAARGGNLGNGFQLSGGDNWEEFAWTFKNSGNRTQPVALTVPNELGLYDMSGNVREWVQDCWNATYAGAPVDGSAWTDGDCSNRTIRGGSWYGKWNNVRVANRF
ncbi:MAG: SUMF1/EgtB/PvdO family nonheme iron enzyme [Albidovulum sp.]|nr:SUMF1/EgtB/PvdO family nonheme iron enzyme [Albidovulum sp.]